HDPFRTGYAYSDKVVVLAEHGVQVVARRASFPSTAHGLRQPAALPDHERVMVVDQVFVDGPPPAVRQERQHIPCPPLTKFLMILKQTATSRHIHHLQATADA